MKRMTWLLLIALVLSVFAAGCGDDDDDDDTGSDDDDDDDDDAGDDDDDDDNDDDNDDNDDNDTADYWEPSTVAPIEVHPAQRGQEVIRGIIHLHSVYSHDACDNFPWIDGHPNWNCFNQLREAICTTNQQYVMLTDHKDPFSYHEFPDVLLYTPGEGDELVYKDTDPVANIIQCDDGNEALLTAGNENRIMPVSIDRMPEGDGDARKAFFGRSDPAVVVQMQALGASVFVNHSEDWTTGELEALPIDGIEIYNLHANIDPGGIVAPPLITLIFDVLQFLFPLGQSGHSDLIFLTFLMDNDISLAHWDALLDLRRTVGIMATDAHRNSLPFPLPDGDRADSYRRMMRWFANYILVEDRTVETIKEAVDSGRLYGAFQVFGEPVGFGFWAQDAKAVYEMGDEVTYDTGLTLHVDKPDFWNMDPALPAPSFTLRILRGGAVVAEATDQDLVFTVTEPGAYRSEVRVVPHHLAGWLGDDGEGLIHDYPLIYGNPIYVVS